MTLLSRYLTLWLLVGWWLWPSLAGADGSCLTVWDQPAVNKSWQSGVQSSQATVYSLQHPPPSLPTQHSSHNTGITSSVEQSLTRLHTTTTSTRARRLGWCLAWLVIRLSQWHQLTAVQAPSHCPREADWELETAEPANSSQAAGLSTAGILTAFQYQLPTTNYQHLQLHTQILPVKQI